MSDIAGWGTADDIGDLLAEQEWMRRQAAESNLPDGPPDRVGKIPGSECVVVLHSDPGSNPSTTNGAHR